MESEAQQSELVSRLIVGGSAFVVAVLQVFDLHWRLDDGVAGLVVAWA